MPNAQYNAAFTHFGRFSLNSFIRSTKSNHMQQNGASSTSMTKPKILQIVQMTHEKKVRSSHHEKSFSNAHGRERDHRPEAVDEIHCNEAISDVTMNHRGDHCQIVVEKQRKRLSFAFEQRLNGKRKPSHVLFHFHITNANSQTPPMMPSARVAHRIYHAPSAFGGGCIILTILLSFHFLPPKTHEQNVAYSRRPLSLSL